MSWLDLLREALGLSREALRARQDGLRRQLERERARRIAAERKAADAWRSQQILTHYADIDRRKAGGS